MIPEIKEFFGAASSYATLHQATVSLAEMGERTITTQVRIDGDVVPSFSGWELEFRGERFVLPTDVPQASKDNTTRNSLIDLTFESKPVQDFKRYFFFEPVSVDASTAIADKYKDSVNLNLEDFIVLLNKVLKFYFGNTVVAQLYMSGQGIYSTSPKPMEIDYSKIWDVMTKTNEVYDIRWKIAEDSGVTYIKFGYPDNEIDSEDHVFEYGYTGGLLKFERQVQDQDLSNILLGRGGEKNLPYRYFKRTDPGNPEWAADPDAIPELANIYFDRLRDINFRWYVRGWMSNENRDKTWEDQGYVYPTYTENDAPLAYRFAYQKGATDDKFNPVEYVKDDESIELYGERWGALDDNDDIYPTIQGKSRSGIGRVDETVAVSPIVTDDIDAMSNASSVERSIEPMTISVSYDTHSPWEYEIDSETFRIPQNKTGNVRYVPVSKPTANESLVRYDTVNSTVVAIDENGNEVPISGLTEGYYRLHLHLVVAADSIDITSISGTFGIEGIVVTIAEEDADAWKPTFDIWVKNIWGTTIGFDDNGDPIAAETVGGNVTQQGAALAYSQRIWTKILGDRVGNEAKVVFSSGFMSISEDYEFVIVDYPTYDTSKMIQTTDVNGDTITVHSEWKITLRKSDAEYDATGLFIPNSTTGGKPYAGDYFFFTGIDMPFAYVMWGEEDLNTYKTSELSKYTTVNPTWVINLDKVRINTEEDADNGMLLADLLSSGTKLHIRDKRFAPGGLTLYVRQITYTWNEPTDDNPYLFPDVEVVLSEDVVSTVTSYAKLQGEVSTIKSQYASISDVEAVVRKVSSPMFLKKTGESDTSASPTTFASKVSSKNFRQGPVGGAGWGLYSDNSEQTTEGDLDIPEDAVLEVDRLIVRKQMDVNSLVVNQISYAGGREIISAAKIEVTKVIDEAGTYTCYFNQKQDSVANLFVVGDIAYGQVFSPENVSLRYYKYVVSDVDVDRIVLSKDTADTGSVAPQAGDVIVQYGNMTNAARQYVIIRDVIGGGYERMISGLTTAYDEQDDKYVYSDGVEYYFAGRQTGSSPRWFVGEKKNLASDQYIEYANGKLTLKGVLDVTDTNESTTISGNFIQTGTIQLGQVVNDEFQVYSGISGEFVNNPSIGNGIAAWYGGPKVDLEVTPSAAQYATSLFRFDGSGYLAGGMLKWGTENGQAFLNLNGENVTVGLGDVSLNDIANLLFDVFPYTSGGQTRYAVKLRDTAYYNGSSVQIDGLFSNGFLSAGGLNASSSGGGGGSSVEWEQLQETGTHIANITIDGTPTAVYAPVGGSGGGGTVTRVSATGSNGISVSGSPITGSGTLTIGVLSDYKLPTMSEWNGKQSLIDSSHKLSASLVSGLATVATSGSYNDLSNKPTVPTESTVAGWGFTKNAGTITGITMNGASKGTSGVVDLGTVLTQHQSLDGYQTKLSASNKLDPTFITTDTTHQWWTNALATTLNAKATDSAVVHKSGNETIGGAKTFSVEITARSLVITEAQDVALTVPEWGLVYCGGDNETLADALNAKMDASGMSAYQLKVPATGSSIIPVYVKTNGTFEACTKYAGGTLVSLNGSPKSGVTASIYAPSYNGMNGQYLVAKGGTTDPTWTSPGTVTSGNMSLVDGGTVYTALQSYLPLAGGTMTGDLYMTQGGKINFDASGDVFIWRATGNNAALFLHNSGHDMYFESAANYIYGGLYPLPTDNVKPNLGSGNWFWGTTYTENIVLPHNGRIWLDTYNDWRRSAYIMRGNASDNDYSLYINAGQDANQSKVNTYLYTNAFCPNASGDYSNIGDPSFCWNNLYAKRWYPDPTNAPDAYIEWDATNQAFKINGPVYSTGQVAAGGIISNS